MILRILKWLGVTIGVILLAVLVLAVLFVGQDTDQLINQVMSPDGKLVAELHENITSRWGGPDSILVLISGEVVYSAENDCSDRTFNAEWDGPKRLDIFSSECDTSSMQPVPVTRTKMDRWQDVTIQCHKMGYWSSPQKWEHHTEELPSPDSKTTAEFRIEGSETAPSPGNPGYVEITILLQASDSTSSMAKNLVYAVRNACSGWIEYSIEWNGPSEINIYSSKCALSLEDLHQNSFVPVMLNRWNDVVIKYHGN